MKNVKVLLGGLLLASFTLTSCGGNSMESEAKKMAKLQCEAMDLMEKAMSGDESAMKDSEKLGKEIEVLAKEIDAKYTNEADQEEFKEIFAKELENCK